MMHGPRLDGLTVEATISHYPAEGLAEGLKEALGGDAGPSGRATISAYPAEGLKGQPPVRAWGYAQATISAYPAQGLKG